MKHKILVAEDSRTLAALIKKKLEADLGLHVDTASSLASVRDLLDDRHVEDYFMAVLDLCLPDAPNGEVVDYVSDRNIPSVVLTGTFNEDLRDQLFSKNIIDYFWKEGGRDLELVTQAVHRVRRNQNSKVLVVDDSRFSRQYISKLLRRQRYQVVEAVDGEEAFKVMEEQPDIKLVITDYNMPKMDGYELIGALRQKRGKDTLGIIGISASEENYLTAKFIKLGANDFINKPFGVEEFYCRVNQNMEIIELMQRIKEASNTDYLTKLFNRRYFFEVGRRAYERHKRGGESMALAMFDIDFFKNVNDTYGHDAGDQVLTRIASLLARHFRPSDTLARFGGEEFCALMAPIQRGDAVNKLESIRALVEQTPIEFGHHQIRVTISIGLAFDCGDALERMISSADERLYQAKKKGRNQICCED